MKQLYVVGLLMTSLLASCSGAPAVTETPTSEPSTSIQAPSSTSEAELPPPPDSTSQSGPVETGSVTINGQLPGGWTYITNNPQYPNPEFYSNGGLKLNYAGQAVKSPVYPTPVLSVKIEGALNKNTRTEGNPTTITLLKVSGETETEIRSVTFSTTGLTTYSETFTITDGASQFKIKLTSNRGYNVNLQTITLG